MPLGTTAKPVSSSFALVVVTPAVGPPLAPHAPRDRTVDQDPSLPLFVPVKPTPLSQVSPLLPAWTAPLDMPVLAPLSEEESSALQDPTPQVLRALAPSVLQDRTVAKELLLPPHAAVVSFPVLVVHRQPTVLLASLVTCASEELKLSAQPVATQYLDSHPAMTALSDHTASKVT